MIVDDQEPNVRLLEGILEQAGYTRLVMTTSPHEVLSLAAAMQPGPDIVLLDLIMPGMDGLQVMEQLRALIPPGDYLPILMLTADASQESKRRALLAGANDFVTKPFDPTEMLLRINNLLQTRSLHLLLQQQNRLLEVKVQQRTEDLTQTLHQVIGAQETERRRLSMDLHDGPLQSLAVCTVAVDRVIRRQKRGEHAIVLRELQELRRSLNSTINDVRLVLADLSLEVLRNRGLAEALHDYLARFCDLTDIRADLDLDEHAIDALSPESQVLLYRLAQEALSNVRKHARASAVELDLRADGDRLRLVVADNGIGFDASAILEEHHAGKQIGLQSMLERIQKAQGELHIASAPGKGTILTFICPLRSKGRA